MAELILIVLGLVIVGGGGGFALARYVRGIVAVLAWLMWLALPFLLLSLLVFVTGHTSGHSHAPGMTAEHLRADAMFGIALVSTFIAPFWFIANLIGGMVGMVVRRRMERG